jgi:hypothetical protein
MKRCICSSHRCTFVSRINGANPVLPSEGFCSDVNPLPVSLNRKWGNRKWGHPPVVFSVSACAVEVYIHLAVTLRKHSSRYCRRRRSVTTQAAACVRSVAVPRAPSGIRLNRVLQWGTGGPWPSLCQVAGIFQRPLRFLTPNLDGLILADSN